ncbi:cerebellar degeneration-related protein 2-like isoform X2 [Bradysia coprophila]|uniref:cerebellar degeneration-related protein 2-like isoform X2 n=1 Tax=Bradysia coprophila TaxID=38358 RepID=UPI00187D9874|nr:cerebellar degeneration-related protein 2-like isoform X2 [Bradysia coprophila]
MASYKEFEFEFEMLLLDLEKGTKQDLQLAAELGKTLLERNKELEGTVKQQQLLIDDHLLEIEYLNKHNVALREVNESRLGCYENLELSILELERTVHRLTTENSSLKRENKTLTTNAETAESRCEELNRQIEELSKQFRSEKRRNDKIIEEQNKQDEIKRTELLKPKLNTSLPCDVSSYNPLLNQSDQESIFRNAHSPNVTSSSMIEQRSDEIDGTQKFNESQNENEEFLRVLDELEGKKRQYLNEQQRVTELEEQLHVIIQENNELQSRLAEAATQEEIKSMHDELSILDEVRRGKMCIRCLRNANDDDMDNKLGDDNFSIAGTEDGDNQSLMSNEMGPKTYHNALSFPPSTLDISLHDSAPSPNPYRELVEKYEALLEVQRQPIRARQPTLQDELTSGDFSSINTKDTDDERCRQMKAQNDPRPRKMCLRTPTDFSEAETLSSGFSDETSNKHTQTEENFLCTIADGDDKFSIYDDATMPIDSRFRNRPEYRELFKEIFAILKRAAENKDEGEKLPLLDDNNPCFKAPPVTPAAEELPPIPDDTESIISSVVSEQSVAMSECITKRERQSIISTVKKHVQKSGQENNPPVGKVLPDGRILTPLKREPLDYLAVSVNVRKKNRRRSRGTPLDRSESPIVPSPPRVYFASGKKRRDYRSMPSSSLANSSVNIGEWNGSSMTIYNKSMQSPSTSSTMNTTYQSTPVGKTPDFRRRTSTASQDLHKLRKLELSYAEVLRRADTKNMHRK